MGSLVRSLPRPVGARSASLSARLGAVSDPERGAWYQRLVRLVPSMLDLVVFLVLFAFWAGTSFLPLVLVIL